MTKAKKAAPAKAAKKAAPKKAAKKAAPKKAATKVPTFGDDLTNPFAAGALDVAKLPVDASLPDILAALGAKVDAGRSVLVIRGERWTLGMFKAMVVRAWRGMMEGAEVESE